MNKWLKEVVNFIDEVRAQYPDAEVCEGAEIGYYNGNDGTSFDWKCNDRLCEFGIGHKTSNLYTFKCFVYKSGKAVIFCYPRGEWETVATVTRELFDDYGAKCLYYHMERSYDDKGNWDCLLKDVERGL